MRTVAGRTPRLAMRDDPYCFQDTFLTLFDTTGAGQGHRISTRPETENSGTHDHLHQG